MRSHYSLTMTVAAIATIAGCATNRALTPPEVPAALHVPTDQVMNVEALATGVQIYEC